MSTQVQYFGMIAEKLGIDSEYLTIDVAQKTMDLRTFFESKYPVLGDMSYKIAVNQKLTYHVDPGTVISEVALLPPFAGG